MRTRYIYLLTLGLFLADILLVNGIYFGSLVIVRHFHPDARFQLYRENLLVYNFIWLACAGQFGMYRESTMRLLENQYRATWRAALFFSIGLSLYFYVANNTDFTKLFLVTLFATTSIAFLLSRFLLTAIEIVYRRKFRERVRVAVLGFNSTGIKLADYFSRHSIDYDFAGILDEKHQIHHFDNDKLQQHLHHHIQEAAQDQVTEIYASLPLGSLSRAKPALTFAEAQCVRLKLVPDLSTSLAPRFNIGLISNMPVFSLRPEPLEAMPARFKKRAFDLVFCSLVIIFIMSWLYPLIGLLIKLRSPGPVMFKQLRSGRNNKSFWCYKFRSMRVNTESDMEQASKNDSRITPIGRFLRSSSIDEMPQFFNVFMGEMSVVGPRPHMLAHTEQYRAIIDTYMVRHFVKPGITGWAQVKGFRGETRDPRLMEERVIRDIQYLEHWSLMMDIRIIFMTIFITLRGDDKAF